MVGGYSARFLGVGVLGLILGDYGFWFFVVLGFVVFLGGLTTKKPPRLVAFPLITLFLLCKVLL